MQASHVGVSCAAKKPAKFKSRCVTNWTDGKYPDWDVGEVPKGTGETFFSAWATNVEVIKVDPTARLVQVSFEYDPPSYLGGPSSTTAWVNADTLDCTHPNIGKYHARRGEPSPFNCPYTLELLVNGKERDDSIEITDTMARGYLADAKERYRKIYELAECDMNNLIETYKGTISGDEARAESMHEASEELYRQYQRAAAIYGDDCETLPKWKGLPEIAQIQGQRTCRLVKASYEFIKSEFGISADDAITAPTPAKLRYEGKRIQEKVEKFKLSFMEPDNHQLEFRMALLYGIRDPKKRSATFKSMGLAFSSKGLSDMETAMGVRPPPGSLVGPVMELHNGYVFGGTGSGAIYGFGVDCSQLISNVFFEGISGSATTYQLNRIARYHEGSKEKPDAPWDQYLDCFASVNLRAGAEPEPADIIITRDDDGGHVAVVESYNRKTGVVDTIEASGGKLNKPGESRRPVFEPPCVGTTALGDNWDTRPVRGDLTVLRLVEKPGCPLKWGKTKSFGKKLARK